MESSQNASYNMSAATATHKYKEILAIGRPFEPFILQK